MSALFPRDEFADAVECDHEELQPYQLANRVPSSSIKRWSSKARTGWELFYRVLRDASLERLQRTNNVDCPHSEAYFDRGFSDKRLNLLSMAVTTELLTYRRLNETDPWISPNFDMLEVLNSLRNGSEIAIGLVKNDMINTCDCGMVDGIVEPHGGLRAEHVMKYHFSNLEDWSRTTFIPPKETFI